MKFLAILRDSLRETIDTKVFYVMVVLRLLLTLIALGTGFTPGSTEDAMKAIAKLSLPLEVPGLSAEERDAMNKLMFFFEQKTAYEITHLKALDDVSNPPEGRYRFVLRRKNL